MKRALIICYVLLNMISLHAQDPVFKWASSFGANESVFSMAIITDANGNLYTIGSFSGTHDFDTGPGIYELTSKGSNDIFIEKTDPGGNFVWARSIGGAGEEFGYSMVRDINGNIYISGEFQLTVDFDPGPGIDSRTAERDRDMFICKLDPLGDFLWVVTIRGLGMQAANFLATDDDGNVYMSGNFTGVVDFDPGPGTTSLSSDEQLGDIFIVKLDASGKFIWVKEIEIQIYGYVFDIVVDHSGNIYTTGNFRGTVDFDPGAADHSMTTHGEEDAFILKLDTDGNFLWAVQFGGAGIDDGTSLQVDYMGNVYCVGEFNGTVDFDPGPGVFNLVNPDGFAAPYVVKLGVSGDLIWAKKVGNVNSVIRGLAIDKSGNVYITGLFSQTMDFDPGITNDDLTANLTDMFLAKFTTDGDFEWSQQVTGPGLDYGLALAVDEYGNIFTTGVFHGTADFDPGSGEYKLTSTGEGDVYILKTGICGQAILSSLTDTTCKSFTLNDKTYTTSGTYKQTFINSSGCDSTITLDLTVTGTIATTIDKRICEGQSFEGYTTAGSYIDSYTASNGCDSVRTLNLSVVSKPTPNLGKDQLLCTGDTILLSPGEFDTYTWSDGSTSSRLLVKDAGTYSVTVQDACGIASDEIVVKPGPCGVHFPSAFSPNRDGLNDEFRTIASNNFFSAYHLVIYNRWGQKIFESRDPLKGWDGKVNGVLQAAETFVWACNYTQRDNGVKDTKTGTVTLLR